MEKVNKEKSKRIQSVVTYEIVDGQTLDLKCTARICQNRPETGTNPPAKNSPSRPMLHGLFYLPPLEPEDEEPPPRSDEEEEDEESPLDCLYVLIVRQTLSLGEFE